jgi:predicted DNA-binding transcriptional regulator YafY
MHNQNKLFRVLKLLVLLKAKPPKSLRHLAQMLETTTRTVYRYIDLLNDSGFVVEKDIFGKYSLQSEPAMEIQILKKDEIIFLKRLLFNNSSSPMARSLLEKLPLEISVSETTELLARASIGQVLEFVSTAMEEQRQMLLKGYYSASSQTVRDRLVEPVQFTADYTMLYAFDVENKEMRMFNIDRITRVELLEEKWNFSSAHKVLPLDIFGFQKNGEEDFIELELSPRAYLFLIKEYPESKHHVRRLRQREGYSLLAPVHDFKAPARFVLGLPDEVKVLGSPAFHLYLQSTFKQFFDTPSL